LPARWGLPGHPDGPVESHIYTTAAGDRIYFGEGWFDGWCVFLEQPGCAFYAPSDADYFSAFLTMARLTSRECVYASFLLLYLKTEKDVTSDALAVIAAEAAKYGTYAPGAETWLAVIYGGMVAEENKKAAVLRKRIKRLGVHQLLIKGMPIQYAASWSRDRGCMEIQRECEKYGITPDEPSPWDANGNLHL
jgi:hypothetical protein